MFVYYGFGGFPGSSAGKESTCNKETLVRFLGQEGPLEKGYATHSSILGLLWWSAGKESAYSEGETWVRSLGWEDLLEKGTATHSSFLAWRIPWTVYRMGQDWETFTFLWCNSYANHRVVLQTDIGIWGNGFKNIWVFINGGTATQWKLIKTTRSKKKNEVKIYDF